MYPEKIKVLDVLNHHKDSRKINQTIFRNETKLYQNTVLYATTRELTEEGFLVSFTPDHDDFRFELTLKGIHYKDVIKDLAIEKRRVQRAELFAFVSILISAFALIAQIFFR